MSDDVRDFIAAEIAATTRIASLPSGDLGYGADTICVDDLDALMRVTDPAGTAGLAQDAYHYITTTRGTIQDAPDTGRNLLEYLSRASTPQEIANAQDELEKELEKDDRFASVTVAITFDGVSLTCSVTITPEDPALRTFTLVIVVTDGSTILNAIET